MTKIIATSKRNFKLSGKPSPFKKEAFKAYLLKDSSVRVWAGKENELCNFSPLLKGKIVSVHDAILSDGGNTWYYISVKGKYGFIYAGSLCHISNRAAKFLQFLKTYNSIVHSQQE